MRCLDTFACEIHCEDGCFLKPGSLEEVGRSCGESCSVRVAIAESRGSLEWPLVFEALGSLGRGFDVGRLVVDCGRGRAFEAEAGMAELGGAAEIVVMLPMTNLDGACNCSREAEGRRRVPLASTEAAIDARARLSFDGDGRRRLDLGMGKRDIGLGRPGALLSSIAASCSFALCFERVCHRLLCVLLSGTDELAGSGKLCC